MDFPNRKNTIKTTEQAFRSLVQNAKIRLCETNWLLGIGYVYIYIGTLPYIILVNVSSYPEGGAEALHALRLCAPKISEVLYRGGDERW